MRLVCHVVLKHRAQESTLFGISGPGETHDAIDAEDVESDGTEGSERMRAARDQCSESEPEVDSDDDDPDDVLTQERRDLCANAEIAKQPSTNRS